MTRPPVSDAWEETASPSFLARHDARDRAEALAVLAQLERARTPLEARLGGSLAGLEVVLHGSSARLDAAQPRLAARRGATAPVGRRYVVGRAGPRTLHLLSPRVLAGRASNVEGSLEALMLAPVALLARRALLAAHPGLARGGPAGLRRSAAWAWALDGTAQLLAGQARHLAPAVALRLRTGPAPRFPPTLRDATLLGASLVALLGREEGAAGVDRLLAAAAAGEPAGRALERAFAGRPGRRTEQAWRSRLARLAATGADQPATTSRGASATVPSRIA